MTEDERIVREACVDVEFHDDPWPRVYCAGVLFGESSYEGGDSEEEAWKNAAHTVGRRKRQIAEIERERETCSYCLRNTFVYSEHIQDLERILELRLKPTLEQMKRGMR